ncbi:virulence factor family protein [Stenotrophomonas sp. STM01]|uniref:virulence factor family protein n=1 Tax=Stenotrophomonas sp. STM01 TaxID=2769278 RepID=UPI001785A923|nr:virulence factor family protein [Stenotrophomonas sp. STM01]MBD9534836.1 virulence factor family protein [Stenotrophomonas sp. STM01]
MVRARMGVAALALALCALPASALERVSHGRFEQVPVYLPEGAPQRVVLWFAGQGDPVGRQARLQALRADGAMVVDIDTAHLYQVLAREGGSCGFSAGDVENFSRYVQAYLHVPTYRLPVLGGDGDGAALAYAVATQAEPQVFAGLLTDGFCPQLRNATMTCGDAIHGQALQPQPLRFPWLAADGAGPGCSAQAQDVFLKQVPLARGFRRSGKGSALPGERAAAKVLGAQHGVSLPPVPQDLDGLPLVEVPASGRGDTFAIFVSGDGGWAGLDKEVAGALAAADIPVVGVDSLRYFWSERTPAGFATDLGRIVRHYAAQWQRPRVVLIGFSQGADVLPAAINRLPGDAAQAVRMTALLSVGARADYEFHVSNWIGSGDDDGLPIAPELRRLPAARTLCVYGEDDDDALCPKLPAGTAQVVKLPGDHHFEGDYATLAKVILQRLQDGR